MPNATLNYLATLRRGVVTESVRIVVTEEAVELYSVTTSSECDLIALVEISKDGLRTAVYNEVDDEPAALMLFRNPPSPYVSLASLQVLRMAPLQVVRTAFAARVGMTLREAVSVIEMVDAVEVWDAFANAGVQNPASNNPANRAENSDLWRASCDNALRAINAAVKPYGFVVSHKVGRPQLSNGTDTFKIPK